MLTLNAQPREKTQNPEALRKQSLIPAVLYGPKTENTLLAFHEKEFAVVYEEAGESSLVSVQMQEEALPVLIFEVQRDPLSGAFLHADLYQPPMDEEIDITVPLEFEGEAPAVKDYEGTLIKNMYEVEVRALPQNLPHAILVDVGSLATLEDHIAVKDLKIPEGVAVLAEPEEIVAQVVPPEQVEEELARPIEENVEAVEASEKQEGPEEQKEEE